MYHSFTKNIVNWYEFSDNRLRNLKQEIKGQPKDYIININGEEYCQYLTNKYFLEPLEILDESKIIFPPEKKENESKNDDRFYRNPHYYECRISLQFTGNSELWNIQATTWSPSGKPKISIMGQTVVFTFVINAQDPDEFQRENQSNHTGLTKLIEYINNDVKKFNNELSGHIIYTFSNLKTEYVNENLFFAAINVSIDKSNAKTYAVPVISRKKIIEKPNITNKKFTLNPTIDDSTNKNIIECLTQTGASMERKPSLYVGKGEEGIRDFFLTQLELRFEGGTVTGETFNHSGKTDILLKNSDNTNLFVGECKIWKGEKILFETISQLLSYLTWQDTKTSILFFVKNESIVKVINTIRKSILQHENYFKIESENSNRSLSCIFSLPQDEYKHIKCEILLFHFDKD